MGNKAMPISERFHNHYIPVPESGCWIWVGKGDRYGMIRTGTILGGDRRTELAHRVSWELHNGSIPDNMFVLHKCDIGQCVNPDHLFLGTHKDNCQDGLKKGRMYIGDKNPNYKHGRRCRVQT